jgi:hypothetical protein
MADERASIGQASMAADRTVVLRLRAESDDGAVGEALFTYAPADSDYESIIEHVGGLAPGQSKSVPPWSDQV